MTVNGDPIVWTEERLNPLADRSRTLHSNGWILPIAAWIHEASLKDVTAKEVVRGFSGALAPKQALEILQRLSKIGALTELAYPGKPHPRLFRRQAAPYWLLVAGELDALSAGR